jgi:peptidoglycan/LPS O-acetylase OafA/YrhL
MTSRSAGKSETAQRGLLAASPHAQLSYRPDIDGLRAVAVIAVLLFHAFPDLLPGGFVGVDIFFVLSGYLISTIILRDLEQGRFSLRDFYSRRVRRIFPALSLILAASLVGGWLILLPDEWQTLTAQVTAGAGFLSNALLARDAGYFDAAAHTKPLLHLWSLAIEEQFYIFWPLTLLFLWKRVSRIFPAILLVALFSFVLDLAFLRHHPAGTFYNPATRMWELLAGAALGRFTLEYGPAKRNASSEILGAAGALAIMTAFTVVNERTPFPGWWTLLPVLGTVALVRTGSRAWFNRRILSSRIAVFIGLISYPLYLWHWPGLVFLRLVSDSDFSFSVRQVAVLRIVILALSILLAWLTWRFWERPMRTAGRWNSGFRVQVLIGIMASVGLIAAFGATRVGPRLSFPAALESARAKADSRYLPHAHGAAGGSISTFLSKGAHSALLAGDSHMEQYWPRIDAVLKADPLRNNAVFACTGGCPPLPGMNRPSRDYRCPEFFDYWTGLAKQERFTTIVLSAYWEYYTVGEFPGFATQPNPPQALIVDGHPATEQDFDAAWAGLETTLKGFTRKGKRVVIISSSVSSFTFDPQFKLHRVRKTVQPLWRLQPVSRRELEHFLAPIDARLRKLARNSGAEIINPLDYLCQADVCPAVGSDGLPLYRDNNHLRVSRVASLATYIDDVLRP